MFRSVTSYNIGSTSTSNKCVARENLGLCPASPNSGHVEGERTFVDRCSIPAARILHVQQEQEHTACQERATKLLPWKGGEGEHRMQ